ncbi:uncharacterized protein [Dermacentor andersoni]|uniref:uncharacterized protein n=1 Tax=Dermacentor andersoni TaxID=34620 RepID=UPI002155A532|nr:uncharacterized protein LOC126539729 [Dermacentor andersoni]
MSKVWADKTVKSSHDAYLRGLTTGVKQPFGKGQRLIATNVVSEDRFVDGCLNVFQGKKTGDYHKEMDGNRFETWFISVVLGLPPRRVIVMDNASYHSRRVEKIPSLSWRRAEIQDWVGSKAIACHAAMTKKQLLDTVATVKTTFINYRVDAAAECAGFNVLRHSPYRCYCNSIELIWAQIKNGVAAMNTRFKTKDVHNLFLAELEIVTRENWAKAVQHVNGVETHFWELRGFSDMMEPIIITLGSGNNTNESELSDTEPFQ